MTVAALPVPADPIAWALDAARRAPSRYNSRPWRFEVLQDGVAVLLDNPALLPVTDPQGREARLACAAAVFNMRVTLESAGRAPVVDLLPEPVRPELVATVRLGARRPPSPAARRLAASIPERRTQGRLAPRSVPDQVRRGLVRAAEAEGCRLELIDSSPRFAGTAVLIHRAEHIAETDPEFLAERQEWAARARREGGVPTCEPAESAEPEPLAGWPPASPPAEGPALAILLTEGDTAREQLQAGQAMQRVLLSATAAGLTSAFRSAPIEVPAAKAVLDSLFSPEGHPQTLLGFGYVA